MGRANTKNGIKSWPKSERPRELLLDKGPEYVSDAGLVAILLRTGIEGKDAVTLARELLKNFGGLRGLLNADKKDLENIKGLGTAKIAQLLSATEIAKRQLKEEIVCVLCQGADEKTRVREDTRNVLFYAYAVPGIKEHYLKKGLTIAAEIMSEFGQGFIAGVQIF